MCVLDGLLPTLASCYAFSVDRTPLTRVHVTTNTHLESHRRSVTLYTFEHTHIPAYRSTLNSTSRGNRTSSDRDLGSHDSQLTQPHFTIINGVTSRQVKVKETCQCLLPSELFFVFFLTPVNNLIVESVISARSGQMTQRRWCWRGRRRTRGRRRQDRGCNHRQSSALSVDLSYSGLDRLAPNL